MTTATINDRSFDLTENTAELPSLRQHIKSNGFDGTIWTGVSAPVGRQRKTIHAMVYRTIDGRFQIVSAA
jgi:hypothetical protein